MAEVKWLGRKHVDKTITSKLKDESHQRSLNIPLKCVYVSSYQELPVISDELCISSDKIRFNCIPNSDIFKVSKIEIDCTCIRSVQYSKEDNLLRITLKSDIYTKYFIKRTEESDIFKDTIWFCLKIIDCKTFSFIIDHLRDNYFSFFNVSIIPPILHDQFSLQLRKAQPCKENISIATVIDKHILPTFKDIKLSSTPNIPLPQPVVTNATCGNSQDDESKKVKKRKLKRVFDLPVVKIKRPKISPRSNHKLLYSPSPEHSIEIAYRDLLCLFPKKYLNDNIINLYLTYIYHELLTKKQQKASYFFNVFFNTKLIGTSAEQKVDTPATRHQRVAKWTKNVDIFTKDFIVIPVIEDDHWFLVIVCFPWMAGIIDYTHQFDKSNTTSGIPTNNSTFAKNIRIQKQAKIKTEDNVVPMPCILIFDSLNLKHRLEKVNAIRDYLKSEWDSKRKSKDGPLIFDKTTCRGYRPLVPKQKNSTDCGLYLLQYVECFFEKPFKQYNLDMFQKDRNDWFDPSTIEGKRAHIKNIIDSKTKEILPDENDDDDAAAVNFVNIL